MPEEKKSRYGRVDKDSVFAMADRSRINVDDFYAVLWSLADHGWLVFKDDSERTSLMHAWEDGYWACNDDWNSAPEREAATVNSHRDK